MYIDTHCHLTFPELYENRHAIIKRALDANITKIITIGTDIKSSKRSVQIAEEFSNVYAAVGIHPTDLLHAGSQWQNELHALLKHPKVVAVGEIGLDYYWDTTTAIDQKRFFSEQINIAKSLNIPMILHNRRADDDIKEILIKHNYFKAVLHCFSSNDNFAREMLELGLHISFTGNITYGSKKLHRALQVIPFDRLMLETDAPFITPVPYKDKTNEPAYIPLIAEKIAEIKETTVAAIAENTTKTALDFFNLPA